MSTFWHVFKMVIYPVFVKNNNMENINWYSVNLLFTYLVTSLDCKHYIMLVCLLKVFFGNTPSSLVYPWELVTATMGSENVQKRTARHLLTAPTVIIYILVLITVTSQLDSKYFLSMLLMFKYWISRGFRRFLLAQLNNISHYHARSA